MSDLTQSIKRRNQEYACDPIISDLCEAIEGLEERVVRLERIASALTVSVPEGHVDTDWLSWAQAKR